MISGMKDSTNQPHWTVLFQKQFSWKMKIHWVEIWYIPVIHPHPHANVIASHLFLPLKQIFRPPLDHYDVIIHLHSRLLPRGYQALDRVKHETGPASLSRVSSLLPVVNFDPVALYIKELKVCERPLDQTVQTADNLDDLTIYQCFTIWNIHPNYF